jgi:ABC-2 type transport system permease protein
MGVVIAIASKDIREAFRNKSTYLYVAFLFFIAFPYLDGLRTTLARAADQSPATLSSAGRTFVDGTFATLPLTLSMLFCTYLSAYAIVLEKAKRTLESLLATPASLRQVWMGKNVAVALPSVAITGLVLLATVVALNLGIIVPKTGSWVFPQILPLITGLVIVPLLTFEVVAVVSSLQLIVSNPRVANFAFIAVFFAFYFATVTGATASWDFIQIYAAAIVGLALAILMLSRFLTRERVILSSKA